MPLGPFDPFDDDFQRLLAIADGDAKEAKLLRKALHRADASGTGGRLEVDNLALGTFRRSFLGDTRGNTFRDAQLLTDQQLRINARRLAFGGPTDRSREEHSAFCLLMYQGYQIRFLDKHPDETPEEFLERPRKTALNITRIIINALSELYAKRPLRRLSEATADHVRMALMGDQDAGVEGLWSDQWDLDLLEVDRYTRLEGTVGVRPFYDPDAPGKIRLWIFHNHQLRVIPNPDDPFKPLAVIERHEPFGSSGRVVVWTKRTFLTRDEDGKLTGEPHTLGRIPITFFRDRKAASGSFFVEGRGRGLCDANAVINGKLTDLNEVYQYQGFAVPEIVNPAEDDVVLGPRRPQKFEPGPNEPFGINFKAPPPMLEALRAEVNADVEAQFKSNGVPPAALGAQIDRRSLSGVSIREAMRPILKDLRERARLFAPQDRDLTDSALRVRAEHDPGFSYQAEDERDDTGAVTRSSERAIYSIDYQDPDLPLGVKDQLALDEFDIAHGIRTPPDIMRERDPDAFQDDAAAEEAWKENIELMRSVQLPQPMADPEGTDAGLGIQEADLEELVGALLGDTTWVNGNGEGDKLAGRNGSGDLLDVLLTG